MEPTMAMASVPLLASVNAIVLTYRDPRRALSITLVHGACKPAERPCLTI